MMRRTLVVPIAVAAIMLVTLAASVSQAWREWTYSRAIHPQDSSATARATLPADVLAHSENHLADLRVIDDLGAEVPYVLDAPQSQAFTHSESVQIRENSFVPGKFTQVVLELPSSSTFHNTIRIETSESDFMNWVEVAASDDTHLWRIVKARAPISSYSSENITGNLTIHFSENTARYLRLRILDTTHLFRVTGAAVLTLDKQEQKLGSLHPIFSSTEEDSSSTHKVTQYTADISSASLPIAEVSFLTPQPEFYRAVRILGSVDGKEWLHIASGDIYRYKSSAQIEESLQVRFPEVWGYRYWRVEILNGSDLPLTSVELSLGYVERYVVFQPKAERTYSLLYGNPRAVAPIYDLQRTLDSHTRDSASTTILDKEEIISNHIGPKDERPFSERHPRLLLFVLAIAVVILGWSALRALRTPPEATP